MKKLFEYKLQIFAIAFLAFVIMSARGGAASLMPLVRWVIPVIVALFFVSFIKKKIMSSGVAEAFKKQMEQAMEAQRQGAGGGGRTIQLCPKCGSYDRPGHKCKSKA